MWTQCGMCMLEKQVTIRGSTLHGHFGALKALHGTVVTASGALR